MSLPTTRATPSTPMRSKPTCVATAGDAPEPAFSSGSCVLNGRNAVPNRTAVPPGQPANRTAGRPVRGAGYRSRWGASTRGTAASAARCSSWPGHGVFGPTAVLGRPTRLEPLSGPATSESSSVVRQRPCKSGTRHAQKACRAMPATAPAGGHRSSVVRAAQEAPEHSVVAFGEWKVQADRRVSVALVLDKHLVDHRGTLPFSTNRREGGSCGGSRHRRAPEQRRRSEGPWC